MKSSNSILLQITICIGLAAPAGAAIVTYNSEAAFLSAAGTITVESFESSSGSGLSSLTTPMFLLTHSGSTFSVLNSSPSPFGTFATDGAIYLEENTAANNSFHFDNFSSPLSAFGLFITDFGDFGNGPLTLSVNGSQVASIANPSGSAENGSLYYLGVVGTGSDQILDVTLSSPDAIGIDEVSIGYKSTATNSVPDTGSTGFLLGLSLVAAAAARRSRKSRCL